MYPQAGKTCLRNDTGLCYIFLRSALMFKCSGFMFK